MILTSRSRRLLPQTSPEIPPNLETMTRFNIHGNDQSLLPVSTSSIHWTRKVESMTGRPAGKATETSGNGDSTITSDRLAVGKGM